MPVLFQERASGLYSCMLPSTALMFLQPISTMPTFRHHRQGKTMSCVEWNSELKYWSCWVYPLGSVWWENCWKGLPQPPSIMYALSEILIMPCRSRHMDAAG